MQSRRAVRIAATLLVVASVLVGCGGAAGTDGEPVPAAVRPSGAPTGWHLLTVTDDGLALVPEGSGTPVWAVRGAVAAPDGSTVFAARPGSSPASTELAALDRLTGEPMKTWQLDSRLDVAAVAPDGRLVALTAREPERRTTVVVYSPHEARELHRFVIDAWIHPEAFTLDGTSLFVIQQLTDDSPTGYQYVVGLLDLQGEHPDRTSRLGLIGDKMQGIPLGAVLSPTGRYLSTLYRVPPHASHSAAPGSSHSAFVHIADLQDGTARCVDLPPPFGTGAPGEDLISGDDWAVTVTSAGGRKAARLALPAPPPGTVPVPDVVEVATPERLPEGVAQLAGFRYVVHRLR